LGGGVPVTLFSQVINDFYENTYYLLFIRRTQ